MAEVRMFLDRIEKYSPSLGERPSGRRRPSRTRSIASRATSPRATRYLEFARDADQVAVRARMLGLARDLGWLTPDEQRRRDRRDDRRPAGATDVSPADVDQVCALNRDHALDLELDRLPTDRVCGRQGAAGGDPGMSGQRASGTREYCRR